MYLRIAFFDVIFYKSVNWNFDIDNPKRECRDFFWGEGQEEEKRVGNRTRVLIFHPIAVAFLLGVLYTLVFLTR
jgi:hypothetical protein